jgi:hypothetical protein
VVFLTVKPKGISATTESVTWACAIGVPPAIAKITDAITIDKNVFMILSILFFFPNPRPGADLCFLDRVDRPAGQLLRHV